MRIGTFQMYADFNTNQQRGLQQINDVQGQFNGQKIQYGFQDLNINNNVLRLDQEEATLTQNGQAANYANTFAANTDTSLNQVVQTLDAFKVNLVKASNQSFSSTDMIAIANELQSYRTHLVNLANTSINGQFLFSGSDLKQKPIDDYGNYQGNGENINALISSNVQLPFNIDGKNLFLGADNDYQRKLTTNVDHKNLTQLNANPPNDVYITATDKITDLTGNSGDGQYSYFYISGKKSDGTAIKSKISLTPDANMQDLLDRIKLVYGSNVDVQLSTHGQIEIKDGLPGSSQLEFQMVGADQNVNDIATLASSGARITEFQKSGGGPRVASAVSGLQDSFDHSKFIFSTDLHRIDNEKTVNTSDLISNVFGATPSGITLNGTAYNFGAMVNINDFLTQMQSALNTQFGNGNFTASLQSDKVVIRDNTIKSDGTSALTSLSLNGPAITYALPSSIESDRMRFAKDGAYMKANVSQVEKLTNNYATAATKLIDTAGNLTMDGTSYKLDVTKIDGTVLPQATVNFSNAGSTFTVGGTTYNIYSADNPPVATPANSVTYGQLLNVIQMLTSGQLPTDGTAAAYNNAVAGAKTMVDAKLDDRGRIVIQDKTKSVTNATFAIYDSQVNQFNGVALNTTSSYTSTHTFASNNALVVDDPKVSFFDSLQSAIDAVKTNTVRPSPDASDPRNPGVQNALYLIDHIRDHIIRKHTQIGAVSNQFQATKDRTDTLIVNVKSIKSDFADTDIAQASLTINQLTLNYQALLSTAARINSLSLLNYLK